MKRIILLPVALAVLAITQNPGADSNEHGALPKRRGGWGNQAGACPRAPNKGLQATANSVRSCLTPALRRA